MLAGRRRAERVLRVQSADLCHVHQSVAVEERHLPELPKQSKPWQERQSLCYAAVEQLRVHM